MQEMERECDAHHEVDIILGAGIMNMMKKVLVAMAPVVLATNSDGSRKSCGEPNPVLNRILSRLLPQTPSFRSKISNKNK